MASTVMGLNETHTDRCGRCQGLVVEEMNRLTETGESRCIMCGERIDAVVLAPDSSRRGGKRPRVGSATGGPVHETATVCGHITRKGRSMTGSPPDTERPPNHQ